MIQLRYFIFTPHHRLRLYDRICLVLLAFCLDTLYQRRALVILLRPPFAQSTTVVRDSLPVVHHLRLSALA